MSSTASWPSTVPLSTVSRTQESPPKTRVGVAINHGYFRICRSAVQKARHQASAPLKTVMLPLHGVPQAFRGPEAPHSPLPKKTFIHLVFCAVCSVVMAPGGWEGAGSVSSHLTGGLSDLDLGLLTLSQGTQEGLSLSRVYRAGPRETGSHRPCPLLTKGRLGQWENVASRSPSRNLFLLGAPPQLW